MHTDEYPKTSTTVPDAKSAVCGDDESVPLSVELAVDWSDGVSSRWLSRDELD